MYSNKDLEKNYLESEKNFNSETVNNLYNSLINIKNPIFSDAVFLEEQKNISEKKFKDYKICFNIYSIIKNLYNFFKFNFFKKKSNRETEIHKTYDLFQIIIESIKLNNNRLFLNNLDKINLNKKYIYFPLHLVPECSTLYKGNNFINQISKKKNELI